MFDKVNIIPHDISEKGLFKHVENLNREINELAQDKRPELTKIKYDLFLIIKLFLSFKILIVIYLFI